MCNPNKHSLSHLDPARDGRRTLLYLNASSQFMLLSGIIPKRWTINSSGSTVVFVSTSTMSMAGLHPVQSNTFSIGFGEHRATVVGLTDSRDFCHHNASQRVCESRGEVWVVIMCF